MTAIGSGSLGIIASDLLHPAPQAVTIEVGDRLEIDYTYYDQFGRILYSTRAENAPFMRALRDSFEGPYIVPLDSELKPAYHVVGNGSEPEPFVNGTRIELSKNLLGRALGSIVRVPVQGVFAGFQENKSLDRLRGPFNLTYQVATAELGKLAFFRENGTLRVDDLLEGTIVEQDDTTTTFSLNLRNGETLKVRRAGFNASVQIKDDDQFFLRLGAEKGDQFSLLRNCEFVRYVLPAGTYRVTDVSETTIQFSYSPIPFPQLVGASGVIGEYHILRVLKAT